MLRKRKKYKRGECGFIDEELIILKRVDMVVIVDEEGALKEMEILGELREFREMFVDI